MMKNIRFKDYLLDYLEFNKITNKDFANRIGITPKHLIDILSGKRDLSTQIVEAISIVTNIPCDYIYKIELNYKFTKDIEEYLNKENISITEFINKFNYKYLNENKWIDFTDIESKIDIAKDILKFLRVKNPFNLYNIEENICYKSKNDKPELLLLWLEKCYKKMLEQNPLEYNKANIDKLVKYIRNCANNNIFNEDELVKVFNKNGIALVIQEDIPGSKIRGAFKVHKDTPAIYLTYKHKRIADIYFSLLHELAHLKSDFNSAKANSIISYDDTINMEEKADYEAFNWMVDDKYYNNIVKSKDYDIRLESKYPKSFIAYRLAYDKLINYSSSIYQDNNILLF